jgi:hypothetical protein
MRYQNYRHIRNIDRELHRAGYGPIREQLSHSQACEPARRDARYGRFMKLGDGGAFLNVNSTAECWVLNLNTAELNVDSTLSSYAAAHALGAPRKASVILMDEDFNHSFGGLSFSRAIG